MLFVVPKFAKMAVNSLTVNVDALAREKQSRCACDEQKVDVGSRYLPTDDERDEHTEKWFARNADDDDGPLLSVGIDVVTHKLISLFSCCVRDFFLFLISRASRERNACRTKWKTENDMHTIPEPAECGESVRANAVRNHFILFLFNEYWAQCIYRSRRCHSLHNRSVSIWRAHSHTKRVADEWWMVDDNAIPRRWIKVTEK